MSVNLLTLTPREREVWDAAHTSGYLAGHEAGWKAADDHAAEVHYRAVRVVHTMASIPPRNRSADRQRREAIEARWAN